MPNTIMCPKCLYQRRPEEMDENGECMRCNNLETNRQEDMQSQADSQS